jgi:hypothetical protein
VSRDGKPLPVLLWDMFIDRCVLPVMELIFPCDHPDDSPPPEKAGP